MVAFRRAPRCFPLGLRVEAIGGGNVPQGNGQPMHDLEQDQDPELRWLRGKPSFGLWPVHDFASSNGRFENALGRHNASTAAPPSAGLGWRFQIRRRDPWERVHIVTSFLQDPDPCVAFKYAPIGLDYEWLSRA